MSSYLPPEEQTKIEEIQATRAAAIMAIKAAGPCPATGREHAWVEDDDTFDVCADCRARRRP